MSHSLDHLREVHVEDDVGHVGSELLDEVRMPTVAIDQLHDGAHEDERVRLTDNMSVRSNGLSSGSHTSQCDCPPTTSRAHAMSAEGRRKKTPHVNAAQ